MWQSRNASEILMNRRTRFKFKLFVAGDAPNSVQARSNLATLCRAHLADRYEIEIIDVFRQPKRALVDGIFMTPTLVKTAPGHVCRIVGNLSQASVVMEALGLEMNAT
jgi:circadian clock protein KaiB